MDKKNFISMVRNYLYDTNVLVWKDDELYKMTDSAVKAYSEDTKFFHSVFELVPDFYGGYRYPDDFICFNAGWNAKNFKIKAISEHELEYYFPDPMNLKGYPDFIFDDISDRGKFRLCPNPEDLQNCHHEVYGYGVLDNGEYGTEKDSGEYGVVYTITSFQFAGDIMYSRYAAFEEIKDYTALLYHVLFQAFDTDSEFSAPEKAAYYKQMYNSRIAMFNQVKYKHNGRSSVNNFF